MQRRHREKAGAKIAKIASYKVEDIEVARAA
jgi:hypothetical protein